MDALAYDKLPRYYRQCWDELDNDQQQAAVRAFLTDGRVKDDEIVQDMAKTVLKLGKAAPIASLYFNQPLEVQVRKALACSQRHPMDPFIDDFIRYWLLAHHRPMICAFLDAASVPHSNAMIADDIKHAEPEQWRAGLTTLASYPEHPARIYLGYVLMKTRLRESGEGLWEGLARVAGKGALPVEVKPASAEITVKEQIQESKTGVAAQDMAEESDEFLAYESELIKAIVRGSISRQDQIKAEDAVEMARQVIDSATMRPRSYFLLGFAQGVHRLGADLSGHDGLNEARRMWHVAGYIQGLARVSDETELYAWVNTNRAKVNDFILASRSDALDQVVSFLIKCATDFEDVALYAIVAEKLDVSKNQHRACIVALLGLNLARELSRPGKYEMVFQVLPAVRQILEDVLDHEGSSFHDKAKELLAKHDLREAIARLGSGDQSSAIQLFGRMAHTPGSPSRIEAKAWLALAKAGVTDFFFIYPDGSEDSFRKAGSKMSALLRELDDKSVVYEDLPLNVVACMGIAEVHAKHWDKAHRHFERACSMMTDMGRSPGNRSFLWMRFLRASCQIMALDSTNPQAVAIDLEAVVDSKIKPSAWFYASMLDAATLFPEPRVIQAVIAALPQDDGEKKFRAYESADILRDDPSKRLAYVNWLPVSKLRKSSICDGLDKVIQWDRISGRIEASEVAIDLYEALAADSNELAGRLLGIIEQPHLVPDILTEPEVMEIKVRLLSQLGRDVDAQEVLLQCFRRDAVSPNAWRRQQALGILESLEAAGADLASITSVAGRIRHEFSDVSADNDVILGAGPISIIYVGGNEIQKAYERPIRDELSVRYPNLSLDFVFPGWSSNWIADAESVKSRIPRYNGLVLSYFVRTQFGRMVRKACNDDCPWWSAPGHGKAAITRGILTAARHASTRLLSHRK